MKMYEVVQPQRPVTNVPALRYIVCMRKLEYIFDGLVDTRCESYCGGLLTAD